MSKEIQNIVSEYLFKSNIRRIILIEKIDKEYQKIGKKPDPTNLENLSKNIKYFTHLLNKNI